MAKIKPRMSKPHRDVRSLLQEIYPGLQIRDEMSIDTEVDGRPTVLFVDLCVPAINLCIEVHGRQHREFVPHFHGNMQAFYSAQARDEAKSQALKDAGYVLVVIHDDEISDLTPKRLLKIIRKAQS